MGFLIRLVIYQQKIGENLLVGLLLFNLFCTTVISNGKISVSYSLIITTHRVRTNVLLLVLLIATSTSVMYRTLLFPVQLLIMEVYLFYSHIRRILLSHVKYVVISNS